METGETTNMENVVVKLPPNLNISNDNAASEWKFWLTNFEDYLIISGKDKHSDLVKLSLLRNMMGPEAARIVSTIPNIGSEKKYTNVIEAITAHIKTLELMLCSSVSSLMKESSLKGSPLILS